MTQVAHFSASPEIDVYRLTTEAFPDFPVHVYVLLGCGPPTLVDAGSSEESSIVGLQTAMAALREEYGSFVDWPDIERIVLTHGHIDHAGGLSEVADWCAPGVKVGVHELDRRIVEAHGERLAVATRAFAAFLADSGVPEEQRAGLLEVFTYSKQKVVSVPVDFTLDDGAELDGMNIWHTPGHCPGLVCLGVGDVLLTSDHILPRITPHQSPESITPGTGLRTYFDSLARTARYGGGFRLGLGGHEGVIENVSQRIEEIRVSHQKRLAAVEKILAKADEPLTIAEVAARLFRRLRGVHVLLGLEEAAAHMEYLYQTGRLAIADWQDTEDESAAWRYTLA